jgi:hypothetical protein
MCVYIYVYMCVYVHVHVYTQVAKHFSEDFWGMKCLPCRLTLLNYTLVLKHLTLGTKISCEP